MPGDMRVDLRGGGVVRRVVPFGTVRRVRVETFEPAGGRIAAVFTDRDDPKEGYVCLYRPADFAGSVGGTGTLTFTPGGPAGGYWKYREDEPNGG